MLPPRSEARPDPWASQLSPAHLLLLAISSRCLSMVSIKSRNWGQRRQSPVRARTRWEGGDPHQAQDCGGGVGPAQGNLLTRPEGQTREAVPEPGVSHSERVRGPGGPSTMQPGRAGGSVRRHHAHLPGLLFLQVPHLLAEHAGAGAVLPDGGLPVLVVVHGLLCGEAPSYPAGAAQPGPCSEASSPRVRPMRGNGSPTTMQTPRALGAEGLQCGCGGCQTGGGHTQKEASAPRPEVKGHGVTLSGERLCSGKTWAALGEGPGRSGPGVRSSDNSWGDPEAGPG